MKLSISKMKKKKHIYRVANAKIHSYFPSFHFIYIYIAIKALSFLFFLFSPFFSCYGLNDKFKQEKKLNSIGKNCLNIKSFVYSFK